MKIRTKLLVSLVLLSLAPVATVGWMAYAGSRQELRRGVLEHLASVADLQAARVETAVAGYGERADRLATDPLLRLLMAAYDGNPEPERVAQLTRVLEDEVESDRALAAAWVVDGARTVLVEADPDATGAPSASVIDGLLDSLRVEITAAAGPGASGTVDLLGASPIRIQDREVAHLVVRHDPTELLEVLGDFTGIGATGEFLLARRAGSDALLVAPTRHDPAAAFRLRISIDSLARPMAHALSGRSGTVTDAIDYRGQPVLAAVRYLTGPDWGLVVKLDLEEAYAPLRTLGGRTALLGIIALALILAAAAEGSRRLAGPIVELTDAADRISRGDRSARARTKGRDEIGRLAAGFNRMADHLVEANETLEARVAERTAELEESQLRIRAMVEDVEDYAIVLLDPDGVIETWNRGATAATGYEPDEAIGMSFASLFPVETTRGASLAVDLARAEAEGSTRFDDWMVRKSGERFWASVAVTALHRGDTLEGFSVVTSDMTYRIIAEGRQKRFFQLSTELLCIATTDGYFAELNPAWSTLLGWTVEELKAKPFLDFVHPDDRPATEAEAARLGEGGRSVHFENRYRTRSGEYRRLSWNARMSPEGDQVLAAARDVTAEHEVLQELERARRAAEAAARSKADFLANMSHEIRTPMNAVIGLTALLADTELDGRQAEYVDTIASSGDHLLGVINDILDFSKIEAGMLQLDVHPTAVRALVEEALDLVATTATEKEIELGYLMSPDAPAGVHVDADRVRQVLVNLLSNAVKFTDAGHVIVRVDARPEEGEGGLITFSVADTGTGIAPEALSRIFDAFEQEDVSSTRRFGGTGLGLAISRRLCELMGGELRAESQPGQGSTFHATVRYTLAPLPEPTVEPWRDSPVDLSGRRVLIVDDTAVNRTILREQVESWGMRATVCDGGPSALELAREGEQWDVALLDHQMPGMDGVQLVEALTEAMQAPPPFIIATSRGPGPALDHPSIRGVISKPLKPSRVFDRIAEVLYGSVDPGSSPARPNFDPSFAEQHPLRILLAEDNKVNQMVATSVLRQLGYDPAVVEDGSAVLAHLEEERVDLILMDVQMPVMDGLEATRAVRAQLAAAEQPRIVAMTAHAGESYRQECLDAGMDDYVSKPVAPEELAAALERTSLARRG